MQVQATGSPQTRDARIVIAPAGSPPGLEREAATPAPGQGIDEWIQPLQAIGLSQLDTELGARLQRIARLEHCLCVLLDHGCAGLAPLAPRLHGTMPPGLQQLYAQLIVERDPLLARATQEGCTLVGTIEEHRAWLRARTRNAEVVLAWLARLALAGAGHLAVIPAKGWLSRGALFACCAQAPRDTEVFALYYAAQRLALTLELRDRPYLAELARLRFTARELEVLRAGLRGARDGEIAAQLGISVDAIRYYFKKFKHRVPTAVGHLRPRELARILHQMGRL